MIIPLVKIEKVWYNIMQGVDNGQLPVPRKSAQQLKTNKRKVTTMSANIESGMYVRIPAWHQEGTTIQFDPNTYEAQIIAGLNWTVEKKRLGFTDNFGVFHETDSYGLVRDKDSAFYGICKDKYQIFNESIRDL